MSEASWKLGVREKLALELAVAVRVYEATEPERLKVNMALASDEPEIEGVMSPVETE